MKKQLFLSGVVMAFLASNAVFAEDNDPMQNGGINSTGSSMSNDTTGTGSSMPNDPHAMGNDSLTTTPTTPNTPNTAPAPTTPPSSDYNSGQ